MYNKDGFGKPSYDPLNEYLKNENRIHLEFINLSTPEQVLEFVNEWGRPPSMRAGEPPDKLGELPRSPDLDVGEILKEAARMRECFEFFTLLEEPTRQRLTVLRECLAEAVKRYLWVIPPMFGKTDKDFAFHDYLNLVGDVPGESETSVKLISRGKEAGELTENVARTAELIRDPKRVSDDMVIEGARYLLRVLLSQQLQRSSPALDFVDGRATATFVTRPYDLLSAMYVMFWLDVTEGRLLRQCADESCREFFVASRINMIFCDNACAHRHNVRESYRRTKAKHKPRKKTLKSTKGGKR